MTKANQNPKNAESIDVAAAADKKHLPWYRLPLVKRIFIGFISLLCAMFLWGYVLMSQNPNREKQFGGVTLSFESGSEADLSARKLMVYGKVSEILRDVNVTVSAPLTDMTRLTARDIIATVNLNDVHVAGNYQLEIKATCTSGTVTAIEPAFIEVQIDDVVDRSIPIKHAYEGEMPDGYWHGEPTLLSSSYTLSGASSDVKNVESAMCYINLSELTDRDLQSEQYIKSIELVLLDSDGEVVESSLFPNNLPSVTVRMDLLPYKDVQILFDLDTESLPDIFVVDNYSLNYSTLRIACTSVQLNHLPSLTTTPVQVSDISEAGEYVFPLELHGIPEGAVLLTSDKITATITVRDKMETYDYDSPITLVGVDTELGFAYDYDIDLVKVTVTGPARLVRLFSSAYIRVIVNVQGYSRGSHSLSVEWEVADQEQEAWLSLLTFDFSPDTVTVTIS